jgi:hypothetical protein
MGVLALLNEDLSIVSSKHTKKKICLDWPFLSHIDI